MAVVIGEAAVAIRADPPSAADVERQAGGPILDGLRNVGGKGAALLGGLLGGAALGSAFTSSLEAEALGDKLNAQLGASGAYAAELGDIAGSLYADAYGDSLGSVNDALRAVVQSGAVMEDASVEQIEAITASALNLATAFEQDVGATATAAGRLVQTGLADTAEQAMDILTRGFQQGADRGGDLLDVLNEYGTTFDELGLDGAQSVGLLNQALAAGIPNADFAADALREMGIIGREAGEGAAEAIESLGLSSEDYFAAMQEGGPAAAGALDSVLDALRATEDPALRSAAATELVGTQYEDLGDAILQLDPSNATAALGEIDGAAGRMGDTLNNNASTNLTSFMRSAQTLAVDVLGGRLLPAITAGAAFLNDAFGPAVSAVAGFISGTVVPVLQDLATWMSENSTVIQTVGAVIAAVFLPHLALLSAQSTITGLRVAAAWVMTQAGAIRAAAVHSAQIVAMIARWVLLAATATAQALLMAAAWVIGVITPAAAAAVAFAGVVARVVAGWVLMGTQSLIQAARIAAAWLIAMGPIGWIIAAVIGIVALIILNWDKIKAVTTAAWNAIVGFVSGAWNGIKNAVVGGISAVVGFVTGLPGRIVGALGSFGRLLYNKGSELMQGLVDGIAAAASFVGNVARNIVNAVIRFINSNIIDGINNLLDFTIMGVRINPPDIPRIPTLHEGGIFTADGGEGLALLRDQERVITPEQRVIADRLLSDLLSGSLAAGTATTAATGGGVTVENHITQQPGEDGATLAARITQGTIWNLNAGITRRVGAGAGAFA